MKQVPQFIDLFAGCGGFSVGMTDAGFESTVKVEVDSWASETLRENFPKSHIFEGDIKKIPDNAIQALRGAEVIVGGPPCQGFSVAGPSQFGINDPRNELVYYFLKWVKLVQPIFAVLENVPAILNKRGGDGFSIPDVIRRELIQYNYNVEVWTINSAEFGVPQFRKRAFIIMSKEPYQIKRPSPLYGPLSTDGELEYGGALKPYVTAWDALSDLPSINAGESVEDFDSYPHQPSNDYQKHMRRASRGVMNHAAMRHTARLIERFRQIKPGQSLKDAPLKNGQITKHTGEVNENPFKYNNYRVVADTPSLTIPASFQSLFIHPVSDRNLTAREAARLMGFPDHFRFCGKRTTMGWERHLSQYNQIGNAVCPPVAQAIGVALIEALKTAESREICSVASFILLSDSLKNPTLDCEHSTSDREDFENLRLSLAAADRILIQEHNLDGILVVGDEIKWNGYLLPLGVIWFSIMVIRDNACDICKRESPPFGVHGGSIQLLISKEDLVSLVRKERDHGLDYHLRKSFNCEMHLADSVAAILTAMGLGTVSLLPNPRTGKPGRAITISTELHPPSEVATLYHAWKENYKAGLELGKTVTADILSV